MLATAEEAALEDGAAEETDGDVVVAEVEGDEGVEEGAGVEVDAEAGSFDAACEDAAGVDELLTALPAEPVSVAKTATELTENINISVIVKIKTFSIRFIRITSFHVSFKGWKIKKSKSKNTQL